MAFKHGVRNINLPGTGGTITVGESCVPFIVGVSPVGPLQTLTLCNNAGDDAQFGDNTPDNNIAKTLGIIRNVVKGASEQPSDGSCPIVVVNVYDVTVHKIALSQTATVDAETGKIALNKTIIGDLDSVVIEHGADDIVVDDGYVYGVDYTLDRYGNFTDITGDYAGESLTFTGYRLSSAAVTGAHIIGGTSGSTKTGLALLDRVAGTFGFKCKILLTPTYNTLTGVAAAFETAANSVKGVYLSDAASGTSKSAALALRSSGIWNTSAKQTRPMWPWLKSYDGWVNADVAYPYAAYAAGLYIANDRNVGYWQSISNQQIPGVTGVETEISTGFDNPGSEAEALNAVGILTYNTGYGLGYYSWGNRNASYPTSTDVLSFDNVYRVDGMVADAMTAAARKHVDKNITSALIDLIKTEGNNFIKGLIQQGALVPGSEIKYDKLDNTASELAAGSLKFRRIYMVTTPAEDIVFYSILDVSLYGNI